MKETLFCERNIKAWIIPLVLFASFVLGFSIWQARNRGKIGLFGLNTNKGKSKADISPTPNTLAIASNTQQPSPPHARIQSAVQPIALVTPYPQYQSWQRGTSNIQNVPPYAPPVRQVTPANPNSQFQQWQYGGSNIQRPLDAVTMATPFGGIQFIGGTQAWIQNANPTTSFHRAVEIIRPCVVNINAIRPGPLAKPVANVNALRFIDPFDGVADKVIGRMAFESVGSGVIVDSSGIVVTNHHVVAGATNIIVTRFQHKEGHYPARIIASNPAKDLALLQILGDGPFPVAVLADSNRIEVGDWVMAVGNPFGLAHTVTAGIISGKRSSLAIGGVNFHGLLQTDAPINKGSSGGPLVNMAGQVVGINTAIYAPTGVFNGTGFAIPSNRVGAFVARFTENNIATVAMQRPIKETIQKTNKSSAAWLGIGVIDMTPNLADKLSFTHMGGVYVSSVVLDSPADEAQISRGDIITAFSRKPVQNTASLRNAISRLRPGQVVSVSIWRGGKTETLELQTRVGRITGG